MLVGKRLRSRHRWRIFTFFDFRKKRFTAEYAEQLYKSLLSLIIGFMAIALNPTYTLDKLS